VLKVSVTSVTKGTVGKKGTKCSRTNCRNTKGKRRKFNAPKISVEDKTNNADDESGRDVRPGKETPVFDSTPLTKSDIPTIVCGFAVD